MLAEVIFTPNEPREKNGTEYIDIRVVLETGQETNIYGEEDTVDWEALHKVEKGQIIGVEPFEIEGRDKTFYRLTEHEIARTLSGSKHPANFAGDKTLEELEEILTDSYIRVNRTLSEADLPIEPTAENVQKIAVTAYLQKNN